MTAGYDVQDARLSRYLADGERHRGVDVAEQEVDLVSVN